MPSQIAALIVCLNIGLCLPVFYANGVACRPGWIAAGGFIGAACYFAIWIFMSRLSVALSPKSFVAKRVFSLGYFVAPLLTYFIVLWLIKSVSH
jgi:hypothetical protein